MITDVFSEAKIDIARLYSSFEKYYSDKFFYSIKNNGFDVSIEKICDEHFDKFPFPVGFLNYKEYYYSFDFPSYINNQDLDIFLEYCDSGIYLNKYFISKCAWLSPAYFDLYNTYRQKYEYNKFCDNSYYIDNCLTFLNENVNFRNDVRELLIHFHRMLGRKPYKKNFFKEFVITFKLGIVFLFKYFQVFILLLIYNKLYKRRCDV